MSAATAEAEPALVTQFRERMTQRGIVGPEADALLSRFRSRVEATARPATGPSPIPNEPSGVVGTALSSAIRFLSPGASVLADEAARGLVRGAIGIPESAAGAVQATGGVMESVGRLADIAPAVAIDATRRAIQNPGQAARAALLGQPMPIDETSVATMQAGIDNAERSPNVLAQTGRAIRQATDPAVEFYGGAKADPSIAPSPLAQARPFSPAGLTSSVSENLPQLAVQLAAAYASGGAGPAGRIAGFAGSAFPMELGGAQAAGREGFMQQGLSADEASQLAAPSAALQAAVNTLIEGLSGAGIFSQAEKAAAKAGLFQRAWQIIKGGTRATVTGGGTEAAQEGVNIGGELASGSNPRAGEGAASRIAQAGLVGGLLEGPAGGAESFRAGMAGTATQQETQRDATRNATPQAPDNRTAPPDNRGQAPDAGAPTMAQDAPTTAGTSEVGGGAQDSQEGRIDGLLAILDDDTKIGTPEWDAARAEIDAMFPGFGENAPNPMTTEAAPVGTPSPADQVASSRPEQDAPVVGNPSESPNSSTQPRGDVAAQPQAQEPSNGQETQGRTQGLLSSDGTAAPAASSDPRGTGAVSADELNKRPASELRKIARANGLDPTGPKSAVVERLLPLGRTVLPAGGGGLPAAALPDLGGSREGDRGRGQPLEPSVARGDITSGSGVVGGSGHARLYAHTQELVSAGSLTADQADVINEAFADADPASLDRIPFRRPMTPEEAARPDGFLNPGLTDIREGKAESVRMLRGLETSRTTNEQTGNERAPEHHGISIFLEEFGHAAVYTALTDAERAAAMAKYNSLTPKQRKKHVRQGLTEDAVAYHAGNEPGQQHGFDEFMASGFRDYVLARSGSQPQSFPAFRKWFAKIGQRLRTALDRVMRRKPIPELQTLHEIMRSGRRDGDAPAATTPSAPASTPTNGPTTLAGPKITRLADDDGTPKSKLQQRREEIAARKATREAVKQVDGTAKEPPTVTEAQALKARYKAETKAANAADREARKEERAKAKQTRRQKIAQLRDEFALMHEVARAAARNQANGSDLVNAMLRRTADSLSKELDRNEMAKGLQEQLVRMVMESMPISIRGKMLTSIRDVKTYTDLWRALSKARKELARYDARDAAKEIERKTRKSILNKLAAPRTDQTSAPRMSIAEASRAYADAVGAQDEGKAMSALAQARRDRIDELLGTVRDASAAMKGAEDAGALEEQARRLRSAADEITEILHQHRLEAVVFKGQNRADRAEMVNKILNRLKARHKLRPQDSTGERMDISARKKLFFIHGDVETIASELDDHFADEVNDDVAPIRRLLYDDLRKAHTRKFEIVERTNQKLDDAAKRAGYLNMHDAMRELGREVLGRASIKRIEVRVGQRTSIPLGVALKIYAMDPDTRAQAARGRLFNFEDDPAASAFKLTAGTFAEIERKLPIELRRFVDEAKAIRDELRPDMFAVHRMMKGYEPPAVQDYEPVRVNRAKRQDDLVELGKIGNARSAADEIETKAWENAGFLQERQAGARQTILLTNWANDLISSVDGAASVIAVAPAVHNAKVVLGNPSVTEALTERFGDRVPARIAQVVAIASGVKFTPRALPAKVMEWIASNTSRAFTWLSESAYFKQLGGIAKIRAEMPASAFLMGVAKVLRPGGRADMLANVPYLRARASVPSQALFTQAGLAGSGMLGGSARAAGRALVESMTAVVTDPTQAHKHLWDVLTKSAPAMMDSVPLAMIFDQIPARIAWEGFKAHAEKTGKSMEWAAEQTERAMRRSANPSNPLDQSGFAVSMRQSGLGFLTAFMGDPFKSYSQLYRASRIGGAYRANVYAGVLVNTVFAATVTEVLKAVWGAVGRSIGGEDDKERDPNETAQRIAINAAKDLIGIIPLGNVAARVVETVAVGTGRGANVIDAPVVSVLNQTAEGLGKVTAAVRTAFEKKTEEEQQRMVSDLLDGTWKTAVGVGALFGFPMPVADRIQRNIRAGMKEEPMSEKVQRFKESMGGPTRDEQKQETKTRKRLIEALGRGDAAGAKAELKALRDSGETVRWIDVRRSFEDTDPLAAVRKQDREKFLLSLKPKERAKILKQRREWEAARSNLNKVWQDATR